MIKEIFILFFAMLAVTMAAVLGMFAAEGIVKRTMPTAAVYAGTIWMAMKLKAYQAKEKVSGWWNHTTGAVSHGYDRTKSGLAKLIPFRSKQPQQAEA